ncbi:hypothetical protein TNCV_1505161 [Trichonephila clavipes]|nr:hypothetical protein TNCV_1505161 [Trichonephila clavipes]
MKLKLRKKKFIKQHDEIMDSNDENESEFEKSDEHGNFVSEEKFCKCYLKNSVKIDIKPQVYHKTTITL